MKSIIKFSFLFVLLAVFACNTNKQSQSATAANTEAKPSRPDHSAQAEALHKQLQLSEKQAAQFKLIKDKYRSEMEALRTASNGDRRAMREKMNSIRDRENSEIKTILTDSQYSIYLKSMEERRPPRRGSKRGGPGNG